MTKYTITTDAVSQTIEADTADDAARQFASSEKVYAGCETVEDIEERADELGGWANVEESRN